MGEDLLTQRGIKGVHIHLNSFWGGSEHKRCVQLTITPNYVQMTYDDARDFFLRCIDSINEIERKYNENAPWWEKAQSFQSSTQRTNE